MAEEINLNIRVGATIESVKSCPTVTDGTTPIIVWTVPDGIAQKRFAIQINAEEDGKIGYYNSGEVISSSTVYQFPVGSPMNENFDGLLSIEIAISEDGRTGEDFEYTSGENQNYYVLDRISETLLNSPAAFFQWKNSIDPDEGQTLLYRLLASKDPTFTNVFDELIDEEVAESDFGAITKHLDTIDTGVTYFWKVRAYDGIDWSSWTIVNGFINYSNYYPVIEINSATPTNNDNGDVLINFTVSDLDGDTIHVISKYTGGNVGDTKTRMSLVNPLVSLPSGTYEITWRSGYDEQLISADDYYIYMTPYDYVGAGIEKYYGPISLDNSLIGQDKGGFGAIEIEFPISGNIVKLIESPTEGHEFPVTGSVLITSTLFNQNYPVTTPYLHSWQHYSQGLLSDDIGNIDGSTSDRNFGHDSEEGSQALFFAHGIQISPNETGGGIGETELIELDTEEPNFTSSVEYVGSDGYHIPINEKNFSRVGMRFGYVKFLEYKPYDRQLCSACSGNGWRVEDLIHVSGEYYQRQACPVCGGSRFSNDRLGDLQSYSYAVYKPVDDWFYPLSYDYHSAFCLFSPDIIHGDQFRYGSIVNDEALFPKPNNLDETVHQIDGTSLSNGRFIASGVYPYLNIQGRMAKKVWSNYDPPGHDFPVQGYLLYESIRTSQYFPLYGQIVGEKQNYITGYGPSEADGFARRDVPTHRWEKGIFKLEGEITSDEVVEPLNIIYLQGFWDAYNTIHWQATISQTSRIHLQVSKLFSDGSHTEYYDVIAENSEFLEDANIYLVDPNVWHAYWDTVTTQLMQGNYDYRLRIRQYDLRSGTFSRWIYSNKFLINHTASNPVNITNTRYEPWTKILYITLRLDDTQENRYDITNMWYTIDGETFYKINRGDIIGERYSLSSTEGENTHIILWNTSSANLPPGNKYRVKIEVIPSSITAGMSYPYFNWTKDNNPILRMAELELMEIQGRLQEYYYDEETGELTKADPPIAIAGKIDRVQNRINELELLPPPSGKYNFYTPPNENGVLTDTDGYREWLSEEIVPGITRNQLIEQKASELDELRYDEVPYWQSVRDSVEREIRCNLIDQGFYCNGFINNNPGSGIFRFRVESQPIGDNALDDEDYNPVYDSRYDVYHRLQLDFFSSFDSQLDGKPLRDVFFDENGERLQGGSRTRSVTTTASGVIDLQEGYVKETWDGFGDDEGHEWDNGYTVENEGGFLDDGITRTTTDDPTPMATYTLPSGLYPGERSNYYLNSSYPTVSDTLPNGVTSFETEYQWRVTSYNIISDDVVEQPNIVITNENKYSSVDTSIIDVIYTIEGDEDIESASIESLYYSASGKAPEWEQHTELSFPTDRPVGYEAQSIENPTIWVPYGLDRSGPSIIKINHQYYLWYSKNDSFNQPTIVHARGKTCDVFGEYNESFKTPNTTLYSYNGTQALYAPCVIYDSGIYKMWLTMNDGGSNSIAYTTSVDAASWEQPTVVTGLHTDIYMPTVYHDGVTYHMWYCKTDGTSKIYYATSDNGFVFTQCNGGNPVIQDSYNISSPCVIYDNEYHIFYAKDDVFGDSRIYEQTSIDGINWSNELLIIDIENSTNPFVITDYYFGHSTYRIYYNVISGGNTRIHTAILNDRIWSEISVEEGGLVGELYNLSCSKFGNSGNVLRVLLNSMPDQVKDVNIEDLTFGLVFENDLDAKDYIIQSSWITPVTDNNYECELEPDSFTYNEELKSFQFGGIFTNE